MADPPVPGASGSPLNALLAWHRLGEQHFEGLQRLAHGSPDPSVETSARETARAALAWFDGTAATHHRIQEDALFPELVESMAGSDPVCLRELAAAASAGHRDVERLWRTLRPACVALSRGVAATLDADVVTALVEACRANLERADRELIPMARRLLDDAALARLRARLDERGPTARTPAG